ncbi:hypothetical protein BDR07DRAFT_1438661, partial [Suillus spraguei]
NPKGQGEMPKRDHHERAREEPQENPTTKGQGGTMRKFKRPGRDHHEGQGRNHHEGQGRNHKERH